MKQYIDKDTLVAEIDNCIEFFTNKKNEEGISQINKVSFVGRITELQGIKDFIDTLEVKEVDLEKEMDEWRHNHFFGARDDKGAAGEWLTRKSQLDIAKHFFELGLNAQKGE